MESPLLLKGGVYLFLLTGAVSLHGQDIHFSQFYNMPLAVNPAQTGQFQGGYRVAANYRNQWHFLPTPYRTYSAAFDMKMFHNMFNSENTLSGGLYFYSDKAGKGDWSNTTGQLSLAFQNFFNNKRQSLSVGFQGGMTQYQFNPAQLTFGDEIEQGINSTREAFDRTGVTYPDFNAGLLWNSTLTPTMTYYVGGAIQHIAGPRVDFVAEPTNTLSRKYNLHGGLSISITEEWKAYPRALFMHQGGANELYAGSGFRYQLADERGLRFGSWFRYWRHPDALMAMAGFDYGPFKFELSYDINISSLSQVSTGRGALEVSLIYIGTISGLGDDYAIPCYKFF